MKRKKILIDARMASLKHAGIGRYILNLLNEIQKKEKESNFSFALIADKKNLAQLKKQFGGNFTYFPAVSSHYSFWEQFEISFLIGKINPDLVHFPHFNVPLLMKKAYVVTIHDIIKHYSKGKETTTKSSLIYWPKYLAYRLLFRQTIKRAKKIIVPSQWVKNQLIKKYQFVKNKVIVIYEGVDPKIKRVNQKFTQKTLDHYKINSPYILYVGSLYPHKNIPALLKAIKILSDKSYPINLVIISARNVFQERVKKQIKKLGIKNKVKILNFLTDKELAAFYQKATAFVFPSLMEGFGLPGLEAMQCGCPVLAANSSCLPEIYGQAALYFDPQKPEKIAKMVLEVANSFSIRQNLINKGYERVKLFSWEKNVSETLRVYRKII